MATTTTATKPTTTDNAATVKGLVAMLIDGELSTAQLAEQLASGKIDAPTFAAAVEGAANAKASAAASQRALTAKVSAKGAISVYGLNARFPVTLYADQWQRLMSFRDDLSAFIDRNREKLSSK